MGKVGGSYSWNATCDVCGFKFKAQDLKKRWDGLMVCADDYETRHPMDFYRVKDDTHILPFTRTDPVSYLVEYDGILDNYITSAVETSDASPTFPNNQGYSFNILETGKIYGFKFYVDKTVHNYGSVDGTENYRICLYQVNVLGSTTITPFQKIADYSFGPPFHSGWNYRLLSTPISVTRNTTYIISRFTEFAAISTIIANYDDSLVTGDKFQVFTDNTSFQFGYPLTLDLDTYTTASPEIAPTSGKNTTGIIPAIDIMYIKDVGATNKNDNQGAFDLDFGTISHNVLNSDTYNTSSGTVQYDNLFRAEVNGSVTGARVFGGYNEPQNFWVELFLGDGTSSKLTSSEVLILPYTWTFVNFSTPTSFTATDTFYVSAYAASAGPTLTYGLFSYIDGDAETANTDVTYQGSYYDNTLGYSAPTLHITSGAVSPILIDVVFERT